VLRDFFATLIAHNASSAQAVREYFSPSAITALRDIGISRTVAREGTGRAAVSVAVVRHGGRGALCFRVEADAADLHAPKLQEKLSAGLALFAALELEGSRSSQIPQLMLERRVAHLRRLPHQQVELVVCSRLLP
jgi:hypothetical protein